MLNTEGKRVGDDRILILFRDRSHLKPASQFLNVKSSRCEME